MADTNLVAFRSEIYNNAMMSRPLGGPPYLIISNDTNWWPAVGNSFKGNKLKLDSCKFYLKKVNDPVGNIYAKLYSYINILGPGYYTKKGLPSVELACSQPVDVSTITDIPSLVTFTFTGDDKYTLEDEVYDDYFFIVLEFETAIDPEINTNKGVAFGYNNDSIWDAANGNGAACISTGYWAYLTNTLIVSYVYSEAGLLSPPDIPTLLTPENESTIYLNSPQNFSCNIPTNSTRFRLQISDEEDFSHLLTDVISFNNTIYSADYSQAGTYYWRMSNCNSECDWSSWSTAFSINVEKGYTPIGDGGGTPGDGGVTPVIAEDLNIKDTVSVIIGGDDVTDKLLRYTRDQNICSGIGTLELTLRDDGTSYDPWDLVAIFEGDQQAGRFYIAKVERSAKDGTYSIHAQDSSKKLMDYFIAENYIIDYKTTITPWILKFAAEAGVNVSIISLEDSVISSNTSLGMTSAYEQIMQLVQYGGAYFYFNGNGTLIIAKMETVTGGSISVDDSTIQSLNLRRHDSMLRNRAVVWGGTNPVSQEWVFADLSRTTPWNYDANDKRAVVFSNSTIYDTATAQDIARKILNTFATITFEKELSLIGVYPLSVGGRVSISSSTFRGYGLVTSLAVEVSTKGMVTNLILDEKCPRLFAYWGQIDDYVYVGTSGDGVWRKPLDNTNWEDFSDGLPSGCIVTDLYTNEYNFSSITDSGGSYYRRADSSWEELIPSGVITPSGELVSSDDLYAVATTINHLSNDIIVGYNTSGEPNEAYVVVYSGGTPTFGASYPVYISGEDLVKDYNVSIYDLDTNDLNNIVVVDIGSGIYYEPTFLNQGWNYGTMNDNNKYPIEFSHNLFPNIPASGDVFMRNGNGEEFPDGGDYLEGIETIENYNPGLGINQSKIFPSIINDINTQEIYSRNYTQSSGHRFVRVHFEYDPEYGEFGGITATKTYLTDSVATVLGGVRLYKSHLTGDLKVFGYKSENGGLGFYLYTIDFDLSTITGGKIYQTDAFTSTYNPTFTNGGTTLSDRYLYFIQCTKYDDAGYRHLKILYWRIDLDAEITIAGELYDTITGTADTINDPWITAFGLAPKYKDIGFILYIQLTWAYKHIIGLYGNEDGIFNDEIIWEWNASHPTWVTGACVVPAPAYSGPTMYFAGTHNNITNLVGWGGFYICDTSTSERQYYYYYVWLDNTLNPQFTVYTDGNLDGSPDTLTNADLPISLTPISNKAETFTYFFDCYNAWHNTGDIIQRNLYDGTTISEFAFPTLQYPANFYYNGCPSGEIIPTYYSVLEAPMDEAENSHYAIIPYRNYEETSYSLCTVNFNEASGFSYNKIFDTTITPYSHSPNNIILQQSYVVSAQTWYPQPGYMTVGIKLLVPYKLNIVTPNYYNILLEDKENFTVIYETADPYKVELSRPSPTFIYNISESGDTVGLNMYESFTNEINDFDTIIPTYPTYDARLVDFITMSGITLASGDLNSEGDGRYALISSRDAIKGFPVSLSGDSITVATFSGDVNHLETSNNLDYPYIFASTLSGETQTFYQKDNINGMAFVDQYYPSGLGEITIIRLDDRI